MNSTTHLLRIKKIPQEIDIEEICKAKHPNESQRKIPVDLDFLNKSSDLTSLKSKLSPHSSIRRVEQK